MMSLCPRHARMRAMKSLRATAVLTTIMAALLGAAERSAEGQ